MACGDLLGKYFLHERLGAGGMAEVFRATYSPEGGFEKVVAIKSILPDYAQDEDFVTLFRREAELGSLLNHSNLVQELDVGRFQDTYFMAMEHIEGLSPRELLKSHRPLPPTVVAYIGAGLGEALDYVHRRTSLEGLPLNLVHRDVNPPNILLSRIGEVKRPSPSRCAAPGASGCESSSAPSPESSRPIPMGSGSWPASSRRR